MTYDHLMHVPVKDEKGKVVGDATIEFESKEEQEDKSLGIITGITLIGYKFTLKKDA